MGKPVIVDILGIYLNSMFPDDFNEASRAHLSVLIRLISRYGTIIQKIGKIQKPETPTEVFRNLIIPYAVTIYGKMLTSFRILNGYSIEDIIPLAKGISNDQFSTFDLTRSVYECFLQSSWLTSRYITDRERQYVTSWSTIRAYSERATLANVRGLKNGQLEDEADLIIGLKQEIFENYNEILLDDIRNFGKDKYTGVAVWPKATKIHSKVGVSKYHHDYFYKIHSIYSHCEPFAMMQVSYAMDNEQDVNETIALAAPYLIHFSAANLNYLGILFPECENEISNSVDGFKEVIDGSINYLAKESR